ncbi:uncharacterized protein LOC119571509 [Penaeus monodon]|uniref:uncharacterized protein LOC119571509 n=1 Tax=Penaeus monodon TaxID=6687 RepID=UPI0018A74FCD|nr:uncharacterized protein LOC119571509 [Penaeus monodon]
MSLWMKQPPSVVTFSASSTARPSSQGSDSTPPEAEIRVAQHLQRRKGLGSILQRLSNLQTSATYQNGPQIFPPATEAFLHPSTSKHLFTSQLWTSLGQLLDTSIHHTTAYNLAANGMVERFHRTLKTALMSPCSNSMWLSQLPWVLGLQTTPKEELDVSPAEMVFGDPLVVPGEFISSAPSTTRLRRIVGKFAPCKQTYRPPKHRYVPQGLRTMKYVFLRTDANTPPLTPPYSGLYKVTERKEKTFLLQINIYKRLDLDRSSKASVSSGRQHPSSTVHQGGPPPLTYHGVSALIDRRGVYFTQIDRSARCQAAIRCNPTSVFRASLSPKASTQ